MKVLYLSDRYPPDRGGVAVSAARQAAGLARRGLAVEVLRLEAGLSAGTVEATQADGVCVVHVGRAPTEEESLLLLETVALATLRTGRHDLVHGHFAVPTGYLATLVARQAGIPSVCSLRGNDVDRARFSGSRLPMLSWSLTHATAVIGVSTEILDRAQLLAGRESGLHFVRNGVDTEFFCPGAPDPLHVASIAHLPRPWLGFSGEARFKKGLPVLLDLARECARQGRGTVVLAGGVRREDREAVARFRASEPVASERLVELPWSHDREALRSLLRAMDVVVLPSLWEGMPNALLEAMACGRPVVATPAGGIRDVVEPGRSGVLVPIEALGTFVAEVWRLVDLPTGEREAMGRAARDRVVDSFGADREIDDLVAVYRLVLGRNPAG